MIQKLHKKSETCWWCDKQANSKEHRHKKSDVKLLFGKKFKESPIIIRDNNHIKVQGPNSNLLKFPNVLCQDCNNRKSQPFDKAYDIFIKYVLENYNEILKKRAINFRIINKSNPIEFKHNVFRYLTKSFCCRLASNNISINSDIVDYLNYKTDINLLYFKLELRPDLHAFINRQGSDEYEGNIYLSPLKYFKSHKSGNIELVYQFYNLQWLRIYTFYSEKMTENNYPGYKNYCNSITIPVEARYSVDPNLLFKTKPAYKLKEKQNDEWLDEYLDTNIFCIKGKE